MLIEPIPPLAQLLAEANRVEQDAVALSRSFPRAVARTLRLAARASAVNRRAASLNTELARAGVGRRVVLVAPSVPLGVVDPMFRVLLDSDPVAAQVDRQASLLTVLQDGCQAAPNAVGRAVGSSITETGPSGTVEGLRGSRHAQSR